MRTSFASGGGAGSVATIHESASTTVLPVTWIPCRTRAFRPQLVGTPAGRSEVKGRHEVGHTAVDLLRERAGEVAGAQPGLDVGDSYPPVEGRPGPWP